MWLIIGKISLCFLGLYVCKIFIDMIVTFHKCHDYVYSIPGLLIIITLLVAMYKVIISEY